MATPRKYPTLGEFEELKEAVARIEAQLARKPVQSSVYSDAQRIADALGLTDADGVPVAVGDEIRRIDGSEAYLVRQIAVNAAWVDGKALVSVAIDDGSTVTAVDMRLPGHVVTRKATA